MLMIAKMANVGLSPTNQKFILATWDELREAFLERFRPRSFILGLKNSIRDSTKRKGIPTPRVTN